MLYTMHIYRSNIRLSLRSSHTHMHTHAHTHTHIHSCITVDNEQTLNDLLDNLNVETLNEVAEWLLVYWYVPVAIFVGLLILIILLHVTYRRRQPIKQGIRNMRNSIRGRGGAPSVSDAQTGGVGEGAAARRRGPREISQSKEMEFWSGCTLELRAMSS